MDAIKYDPSMYHEVQDEIERCEGNIDGMGCIILDFACYFPFKNLNFFSFEISIGNKRLSDQYLNHRRPDERYFTISRKYGKKICKVGYPIVAPIFAICF